MFKTTNKNHRRASFNIYRVFKLTRFFYSSALPQEAHLSRLYFSNGSFMFGFCTDIMSDSLIEEDLVHSLSLDDIPWVIASTHSTEQKIGLVNGNQF